jgi:hypothetical protein
MDIVLTVLVILILVVLVRFVMERRKNGTSVNRTREVPRDVCQLGLDDLEKSRDVARDKFGGLHRWLSVLLFYPPFVKIDDDPEGLIDRSQTDLGRRFNEDLIAAEQFPVNGSMEQQIAFYDHCFEGVMKKYSKEIAQAVKSRDSAPQYPGHRGMSKVFDEQFNND